MFLFILLLGVLFLFIANSKSSPMGKKECVGQHKWQTRLDTSDGKGYLQCRECSKFPGEDI